MKSYILIFCIACAVSTAFAQNEKVKIVFDVTSPDTKVHEAALRHVSLMANAYPESQFEVVVYSGALPMMLKDKSTVTSEIEAFAHNSNVTFNVCAMTLKRYNLDENALISGVTTVPDGIMEIIKRQNEGWGYIKEAN